MPIKITKTPPKLKPQDISPSPDPNNTSLQETSSTSFPVTDSATAVSRSVSGRAFVEGENHNSIFTPEDLQRRLNHMMAIFKDRMLELVSF